MTIDQALAGIPLWTGASPTRIAPLSGGLTHDTYRVEVGGDSFAVRLWRAGTEALGIDRHREYACTVAAGRTGVAPEVVGFFPREGILVTRFIRGRRPSAAAVARPALLSRVTEAMRCYHAGPAFPGAFSPFAAVRAYVATARAAGSRLPDDIDALGEGTDAIGRALVRPAGGARPCHNDLWGPNLIDDGRRIRVVDWEYAGMGDVAFDLANLAIHYFTSDAGDRALLRAYAGSVTEPAFARLKLLRIVAELREALWYRVAEAILPRTSGFSRRAGRHFARCRRALRDPQVPAWLDLACRDG